MPRRLFYWRRKAPGAFGGGGLGMWRLAFVAVEAGGGSQDKLGHPLVAGIFEHIQVAEGVGVEVAPGIGGAGAHAGNRRQVDHRVRFGDVRRQSGDKIAVGDVVANEMEVLLRQKRLQAVLFHADVIDWAKVVYPKNRMPLAKHQAGNN
jgi:hypothetical protein